MAELRAYQPSLRDRIAWGIAGGLGRFGADRHQQRWAANKIGGLIDFVPGVGDVIGLDDAYRDYQDGNYGLAAVGLGLTAAGAIPGAGDMAVKGLREGADYIRSFRGLRELAEKHGDLFVRWSRGPGFDMAPGARSMDYVTGQMHDGLSSLPLDMGDSDNRIGKFLRDYEFLRTKDPKISPHIYTGRYVGLDTDGGSLIEPSRYLGSVGDDFIQFLSDDRNLERMSLMDQIRTGNSALELYKTNPPKFIPFWTPDRVEELNSKLLQLGGPLDSEFIR